MQTFTIHNHLQPDVTIVHNYFIDEYMIQANGEFVKIYLYLLRHMCTSNNPLTICSMADAFGLTENDIIRALKYWEKINLIKLDYEGKNRITGIHMLSPQLSAAAAASVDAQDKPPAVPTDSTPIQKTESKDNSLKIPNPKKLVISPDKLKALKEKEEIMQLLFIAEQYLGKTLSPTETNTILYFYDELKLSIDLIEYLIEYCVSKGSKSIRYIQAVGHAWYKEGVKTVADAKKSTNLYNKNYFTILNAFGIKGRNPADAEIQLMNNWINEYGFNIDIILEACNRTINQTHQPSFKYADRILFEWKKQGVKHLDDIQKLDQKHLQAKASQPANPKAAAPNKFNNFNQREYDFEQLEKGLLNSDL